MPMIKTHRNICTACCCLLLFSPSFLLYGADQSEQNGINLDTQVVSATGTHTLITDSVIRTEVISAKQLKFMQAKVLTDALQHSSGLTIKQTVKNGSKLNIQGADANHVLILKDGLPFISPTGSETDLSQIPLSGIERIEIIKGAGSALYGSSAMAGVVNLISKEVEGDNFELDISAGQYKDKSNRSYSTKYNQQQSLFVYKKWQQNKFSSQIFHKTSPQVDLNNKTPASDGADQELSSAELRFDRQLENKSLFIRANYLSDEKIKDLSPVIYPGQQSGNAYYQSDSQKISLDGGLNNLKSVLFDRGSVFFRYENYQETSGNFDNFVKDLKQRKVTTQLTKIESQLSKYLNFNTGYAALSFLENHNINYGISYQNNNMKQTKNDGGTIEIPKKDSHTLEAFVQDSLLLSQNQEIIIGARSQYDSDFGQHSSLKANWLMSYDQTQLRLSYGQGYRTPNLKERFYFFDHSNLGYVIQGNLDLKAETSHNFNATLSRQFSQLSLELSAFYNQYQDKIETSSIGVINNTTNYKYNNISKALARGFETSITWQLNDYVYWQASYALLDAIDQESNTRLQNQARHSFKTQLNYQLNHSLSVSLYGTIEMDRYNGRYDLDQNNTSHARIQSVTDSVEKWDIKFNYQLIKNLSLYGSIDNVFDQTKSINYNTVTENDERAVIPRNYQLGMTFSY